MVRTWNQDPTKELGSAIPPNYTTKTHKLTGTPRFFRDANSRIPSFLNPVDGEGHEIYTPKIRTNTSTTHAVFEDRLYTERAVPAIEEAMAESLGPTVGPSCTGPRFSTEKAMVSNDPRFLQMHEPYTTFLGPGQYDMESGSPSIGLLHPSSPLRGSRPAMDPFRMSSAFCSTPRSEAYSSRLGPEGTELARNSPAPDAFYIDPNKIPPPRGIALSATDRRPSAPDWRYSSRLLSVGADLPEADFDLTVNAGGQLTVLAARAAQMRASSLMMISKQTRLADLPVQRSADLRQHTPQQPTDSRHLGPGSYEPMRSLGVSRRRTYRLYSAGNLGCAPSHASLPTSVFAATANKARHRPATSSSSAFTTVNRDMKSGPYNHLTGSLLMRSH
jgi:hypothetical protein